MTNPILSDITKAEQFHATGNLEMAAQLYRKILTHSPGLSRTAYNLGMILIEQQEYHGAEAAFRQSLGNEPDLFEARFNLAFALQEQGKITEALAELIQLSVLRPDSPDVQFNLACLELLLGKLPQGWGGYDQRFQTMSPVAERHLSIPLWDGTIHPGLRLLIVVEQGYGDAIQMARYIPLLHSQGVQVHLEVTAPLLSLFSRINCASCMVRGSTLPEVDYRIPIMSLPRRFKTALESIPAEVPYLTVDPELARHWRQHLPDTGLLKVGLCWAGRLDLPVNRKRSCPTEFLNPLLSCPGTKFISLQKDAPAGFACNDIRLHDFTEKLTDFHQTAALISNLDLVITIDTAIAHLAGALGIPTWLMLPAVPDWRWLLERSNSPWYPTMRLFRQPAPGDWQKVTDNVAYALHELISPKLYLYRDNIDFNSSMTAKRPVPLAEPSPLAQITTDATNADFIVFPYYLERITEFYGIEKMWSFITSLPLFATYPEKHLFFSDHDSDIPYHSLSVWFRASMRDSTADPFSFSLPYQVSIPEEYICANPEAIRYHTCFVGYLGLLRERTPLINGIIAEPRLVHEFDLTTAFHLHQPDEIKDARRTKYLRTVAQSITVLCPKGDGSNSIRFFETLAMGRIAVLSPPTPLPFADRIEYGRFVISIPEGSEAESGRIIYEWLSRLSDEELVNRMAEARKAWESHLSPQSIKSSILSKLVRLKLQRDLFNEPKAPCPADTGSDGYTCQNITELLAANDLFGARELLNISLHLNPRSSKTYLTLGALEISCKDYKEAKRQLLLAIGYDHRNYDAYLLLARVAASEADLQGAVERYYQASLLRPEALEPYQESLPLLEQLGQQDEADFCRKQIALLTTRQEQA